MRCGCISLTRNRLIKMPNQELRKLQPGDRLGLASSAARPPAAWGSARLGQWTVACVRRTKGQLGRTRLGAPGPRGAAPGTGPLRFSPVWTPERKYPLTRHVPTRGRPQAHTPQPHTMPRPPSPRGPCPLGHKRRPEGHRGPRSTRRPHVTGAVCVCGCKVTTQRAGRASGAARPPLLPRVRARCCQGSLPSSTGRPPEWPGHGDGPPAPRVPPWTGLRFRAGPGHLPGRVAGAPPLLRRRAHSLFPLSSLMRTNFQEGIGSLASPSDARSWWVSSGAQHGLCGEEDAQ